MNARPTIVLVGLMGSGKSTVARRLAERLGTSTADTDDIVEASVGKSVRMIFADDGESAFRAAETRALESALTSSVGVVAAAGGVVLSETNRALLHRSRRNGDAVVVWLRADRSTLVQRAEKGAHRPLLDAGADEALERMAAERTPLYTEVSDATVDTDGLSVDEVVDRVLAAVPESQEAQ